MTVDALTVTGAGESKVFPPSAVVTIGRDDGCSLSIENPNVSRRHAQVQAVDGQWMVTDLGSAQGTFADGVRISTKALVDDVELSLGRPGHGEVVRLGLVHQQRTSMDTVFATPLNTRSEQPVAPPAPPAPAPAVEVAYRAQTSVSSEIVRLARPLRKVAVFLEGFAIIATILGVLGGIAFAAQTTTAFDGFDGTQTHHPFVVAGIAVAVFSILSGLFYWCIARTAHLVAVDAAARQGDSICPETAAPAPSHHAVAGTL